MTLTLSATDPVSSVTSMCVSNAAACSAWEPYATTKAWTLAGGPAGTRTVYVKYRNALLEISPQVSDTIVFDATLPVNGTAAAVPSMNQIDLSWAGFSDAHSGIASYTLVFAQDTAPTNCASGTQLQVGPQTSFSHTGLANGTVYGYRVCATDGAGNVSLGATVTSRPPDATPPVGGAVSINAGAQYTGVIAVNLTITAPTDASPVPDMCVSNTALCTAWQPLASTLAWTLGNVMQGPAFVFVKFRDQWGNVSTIVSDSIVVDRVAPANGTVTLTPGDAAIHVSWTGFTDATSGIASYKVVSQTGTAPAVGCGAGTVIYEGAATSYMHTGLVNGTTYYYRVCAIDQLGNTSTGVLKNAYPAPEFDPPAGGGVVINGGAPLTNSTSVQLSFTPAPTDQSGVAMVCVSNSVNCTAWVPYQPTMSWTISGGYGVRTVYAKFRDIFTNTQATAVSGQITIDTAAPTNGTLAAVSGDASVALSWSGFADAGSGVASYKLVFGTAALGSCAVGTVAYTGPLTTFNHAPLVNGTRYYYRVCAIDNAGNISTGAAASSSPAPEHDPPVGGVVQINAGATYTRTTGVRLDLTPPQDASGVTHMCISNTAVCSSWQAAVATKTWSVTAGSGVKTVSVWWRDQWGNAQTTPATDTIIVDSVAPVNGTLSVTPGELSLDVSWTGFTDASSGIASYKLVRSTSGNPINCTSTAYTVAYQGALTAMTDSGLNAGTTYYYRVCAIDNAGNMSTGVVASGVPTNYVPPPGSVLVLTDVAPEISVADDAAVAENNTVVYTSPYGAYGVPFMQAYQPDTYDLIIVEMQYDYLDYEILEALRGHVDAGRKMIVSSPEISQYGELRQITKVLLYQPIYDPEALMVSEAAPRVNLFTYSRTMPSPMHIPNIDWQLGASIEPLDPTGYSPARFNASNGPGAIVITNGSRIITHGFLTQGLNLNGVDADGDGVLDLQELYQNEIKWLTDTNDPLPPPVSGPGLMLCGGSNRNPQELIPAGSNMVVEYGCTPTANTQTMLITRYASGWQASVRSFVSGGGIVITEWSMSAQVFNTVFQTNAAFNGYYGSCQDVVVPTVKFNTSDPFWVANSTVQADPNTGCGNNMSAFPNIVPLGGWSVPGSVSLAYRNYGAGRVWLVEIDWQDGEEYGWADSRALMRYMVGHGGQVGCGNSVVDPGEACDDGNTNDNDACTATCQLGEIQLAGNASQFIGVGLAALGESFTEDYLYGWCPPSAAGVLITSWDGGGEAMPDYSADLAAGRHVLVIGGSCMPEYSAAIQPYIPNEFLCWHTSDCTPDWTKVGSHRVTRYLPATYEFANQSTSYHMLHMPDAPGAGIVNLGQTCDGPNASMLQMRTYPSGGTFTYMALDLGPYDGGATSAEFVQPFLRGYLEYLRYAVPLGGNGAPPPSPIQ